MTVSGPSCSTFTSETSPNIIFVTISGMPAICSSMACMASWMSLKVILVMTFLP